jgi:hypothetical protein
MTFSPPSLSWSSVQTLPSRQDHQPPQSRSYQTYLPPLTLSSQDDRSYRLIKLQNGLEALLVQDPGADKSTAAMDVKVGHLSDPVSSELLGERLAVSWRRERNFRAPTLWCR